MRFLVDTSIWSLVLRRAGKTAMPESQELRRLISNRRVEIIGPIRQEILSGIRESSQFEQLTSHLAAFSDAPLLTEDYITAAQFYNICRAKGIQGSNTDFLICAVAARNSFAIFTADGDFKHFAKHLPILLHHAE
ncbi:TPA: PIN domain nuclease [Candidatus Sumerlaeota bacterium]|jgi:predicted nucleic acid-binding protein|nr:PIN domain nuclease [Candidatus Sumerlaeota bacterium]